MEGLKQLGEAISEVIALRGKLSTLKDKKDSLLTQIDRNNKEISRLQYLVSEVAREEKEKDTLAQEIKTIQGELDERLNILAKAGVTLPLNDDKSIKGFVNL